MLRRFSKDQRGSIAVMFAGLLPVILGGAFLGVEALRLVRAKSQLQQALDAAALAAGQARYEGASAQNIQAVVDRLVAANLSGTVRSDANGGAQWFKRPSALRSIAD